MMAKKIPLKDWAARNYDPPPTPYVLRSWAREGEINPPPEKVGREWYVTENARRGGDAPPAANDNAAPRRLTLVERLQQGVA